MKRYFGTPYGKKIHIVRELAWRGSWPLSLCGTWGDPQDISTRRYGDKPLCKKCEALSNAGAR